MNFKNKIEIEKCAHKILNRVDQVKKLGNFSSEISDEHLDIIIKSAEHIIELVALGEWVRYDTKLGKAVPIQ